MITKDILDKLHEKRLLEKNYGSKPKRMFVNGVFNTNNWNGGDDIIRDFFEDIDNGTEYNVKVICDEESSDVAVITHLDRIVDQSYSTILVDEDIYFFTWYKDRGCTEVAKYNSEVMTEALNSTYKIYNI